MSNKSKNNNNENKFSLLSNNNNNNKNLNENRNLFLKNKKQQQQQQQQQQHQQIEINRNNNSKKPPTPPPLPSTFTTTATNINSKSFAKLAVKMSSNDLLTQAQLVKSRYKLTATALCAEDDFLSIYNQKPKIIKYIPLQGAVNGNNCHNGENISLQVLNNKRLSCQKSVQQPKDEVIQNNAKNSYYLNDAILYNIDNISQKEKMIEKLIISKQGTVRGNLNHVKLSLKQFFKENNNNNTINSNIGNNNSNNQNSNSNSICNEKTSHLNNLTVSCILK